MSRAYCRRWDSLLLIVLLTGGQGAVRATSDGANRGDEREIVGMKLRWCPPGRFIMGSPPDEPRRRFDETQVEVTLTRGFWMGEYEVTQGQWKRVLGKLPGELTAAEARETTFRFTTSITPRLRRSAAD
jgi:formylglycine-generating enzyme required for sulfatase activity